MEKFKALASEIYREEECKHEKQWRTLTAIGRRLAEEHRVRGVEVDGRFVYVSNVKVFDIKAVE